MCSSQPVVPTTTGNLIAASFSILPTTASGMVNSIATSAPAACVEIVADIDAGMNR